MSCHSSAQPDVLFTPLRQSGGRRLRQDHVLGVVGARCGAGELYMQFAPALIPRGIRRWGNMKLLTDN